MEEMRIEYRILMRITVGAQSLGRRIRRWEINYSNESCPIIL
jgi:hypothetical protein